MCAWTDSNESEEPKSKKVKIRKPKRYPKTFKSQHEEALAGQLKSYGFPIPEFQVQLNAERQWTSDLVWCGKFSWYPTLVVEVHGGYGGSIKKEAYRNYEKSNWYVAQGYSVLHITPEMIDDGSALQNIFRTLDKIGYIEWAYDYAKGKEVPEGNRKLRKFYEQWIDIKV